MVEGYEIEVRRESITDKQTMTLLCSPAVQALT